MVLTSDEVDTGSSSVGVKVVILRKIKKGGGGRINRRGAKKRTVM